MAENPAVPPSRRIRFGPFELDAHTGELRKHGIKVRLHEQPFRVLMMLLRQPGEVVLRDDIRQALWPNNTVVEFDHSINAAIQRLRDALTDSADHPRYVETVARRGYRFVGTVEGEAVAPAAVADVGERLDPDDLSGQTFSHFRVIGKLGQGGMGVVYRAEDLKLGRHVALKFLPYPVDDAPAGLVERFRREARSASAVNHPNICTIYGVEEFGGQPAIVMELVEGETLEKRLTRGALGLEKSLPLALQLAEALEAAHRKGIVHRDLKPANVMLTKSGVKVLDFGLAKVERAPVEGGETVTATAQGTLLGTVEYMSPEQAQGKEADSRSDIFSFGLVFYEMITGQRAFHGSNPASIIAAILEREAPTLEPEGLNRVVKACLAKDPADRFQTARDLKRAIEWGAAGEAAMPARARPASVGRQRWWGLGAAAIVIAGMAPFVFLHLREQPPGPTAPVRFQIAAPDNAPLGALLNLSPDGRSIAFIAGGRLWVHSLKSGESRDLTTADGTPFWSPDGRFIGYPVAKKLKRIEATGGPSQTLADIENGWGGGAWGQDDVIVFGDRRLVRVPAAGGVPVPVTVLVSERQDTLHHSPSFLPDGRHFVYSCRSRDQRKSIILVGAVDARPEAQSTAPLVSSFWNPVYAPSPHPDLGYLLFVREGTLWAQLFDNRRLGLTGQAVPVAEHINDGRAFSASNNNVLVFQRSADLQLAWRDRTGKVLGTAGDPGDYLELAVSPNAKRVAVTKGRYPDTSSMWLLDLTGGGAGTPVTFGGNRDMHPIWSPDGNTLAFSSKRDGKLDLYLRPANGGSDETEIYRSTENKTPTSWSRDGRFLFYTAVHPKTRADIWVLPMEGERKAFPFLVTKFAERGAQISPDGQWVAYNSDESGQFEIYVRRFHPNGSTKESMDGGSFHVSAGRGIDPRWRGDGRELFYDVPGGTPMAVEIATKPEFHAGKPRPLENIPPTVGINWDITADGAQFFDFVGKPQPYTLVLNWQTGLKK